MLQFISKMAIYPYLDDWQIYETNLSYPSPTARHPAKLI
ncbi:hypothetical protein AO381_1290 [Moraxella catarrhalis]|nr:hypothetical protein AO381_1290 [Moraxella catarrhalis]